MAQLSVIVGGVLVAIGVWGYVAGNYVSMTALIPAALGAVIALLGVVARSESLRRHAMHGAMSIALLGIIGTFTGLLALLRAIASDTVGTLGLAPMSKALTATVLIGYLAMGVRSFVHARRSAERRTGADRRSGPADRRKGDDRRFN